MNIFRILTTGLLVFMVSAINTYALAVEDEEAIETRALRISMDEKTGTGVIYGKVCDSCKELKVNVTPQTLVYEGRTQVPLAKAKGMLGTEVTVIFSKKTMDVIRIRR